MPSYTVTKPSWFFSALELREKERVIGGLTMLKTWSYALAEARMPGRSTVRFGYKGWNSRSLFMQDANGKEIAAAKSLSWWKRDTAVTLDGKEYVWKQKDAWGMHSGWFASDGREIMEFRMHWWRSTMDIEAPVPLDKTEFQLLLLGMYLTKLREMDAASSGA